MERLKAYSKVNLILKVFPKLKNESKHRIHSLFCLYQSLYDDIQIEESTTTRIVFIRYNKKINIDSTKILLAIDYLSKLLKRTIFLNIIINKKIPVMAGLGGSATDVATIIKWVIKKYNFKLLSTHLKHIALNIGSDIPFFLSNYLSAWVSAYGNKVVQNHKKIPRFKLILTHIPISTTNVYNAMNDKKYRSQVNVKHAYQMLQDQSSTKNVVCNDMWSFANKESAKLNAISSKLSKNKKVILSGSGGTFVEIQ